jgi:cholesterol transport system auxiliary component
MNKAWSGIALLLCSQLLLIACSPVKVAVTNQYKLDAFSTKQFTTHKTDISILVSQPEGLAGNQTEQMHYIEKPFALNSFAHNAWINSPANMLYPLITQSLQKTGYFYAVASGPYLDKADYRIDTQIIELQQNFLTKPSVIELVVKVMITHIPDNRVVASRIIGKRVVCPTDTPYGGVIAANQATRAFTAELSAFVVKQVQQDNR